MANALPRRFVLASAPSMRVAIGEALRRAYTGPDSRSMRVFDRLIERLNRLK